MMKPVQRPSDDGHDLELARHRDVLAAVRGVHVHHDLDHQQHADQHQRRPDGFVEHTVDELDAVVGLDVGDGGDAHQRGGDAAEGEPERQGDVHGPLAPVLPGAGDLGDGGVGDVGADRHGRLEAEDEDQHRRHERAAAHAGEADEEADQQAGEAEVAVEVLAERQVDDEDEDTPAGQTDAPALEPGPGRQPGGLGAGAERRDRVVDLGIVDVAVEGLRLDRHRAALAVGHAVLVVAAGRRPAVRMGASMGASSLSVK